MKHVSHVTIRKRIVAVFLLAIAVFMVMAIRLMIVQFILGDKLTDQAETSWSRDIRFEAKRGKIVDRNGEVLVDNVSAPTVMFVPRQVDDKEVVAEAIATILEVDQDLITEQLNKNISIVRFPEGRKLNEDQALAIQQLGFSGVYLAEDSKRYYPNDRMLAHVLGFSGIDNQGLVGLELAHNEEISGVSGKLSFYSDAKGRRLPGLSDTYQEPVDGKDLKLTIDYAVQSIIERELDIAEATYQPDGAWAIAVNPNTGAILGMSSRPNFHPDDYQSVNSEIYNRNLPIWSTYEPGSTFKIITLAAALEEQLIDLEKDMYYDTGVIEVGGAKLHCWKRGGHGSQTYLEVVQNSCNPGFVSLGQALGKDLMFDYVDAFGFGEKSGVDLAGESTGIIFNRDRVGPVELATTAFGQGVSVTPIQQVMAVSAAVNGGYLYQPYIVDSYLDPISMETIEETAPEVKRQVISEQTSEEVRLALESVVAKGTGRGAYVEGYRVGGKTGTAQKVGTNGRYLENNHIVSFIGFAPADQPEIVVYLAVDNPKNTVQFGGVVAAPIVGNIIEDSLSALGVAKRDDGLEKEYQWPNQPLVEVPDLIGLTQQEMVSYLTQLSIEAVGEGTFVIEQAPAPGEKVPMGDTIRLLFGEKVNDGS
ncbi:stage V sporulation protein D (sporulation-specific penicillin-binding protein) [Amphibacillus marinus]|uniref:serine-type D-Ala-D-Ala carboxypeptidase n=1 Tax=Amphibacillus marinus TaxID=872970 RepID=A0A1H8I5K9_9BACI|nr:stage V sporulation protein D [Amphibacillus marinus]SEN63477.1 stage V sporulation protein D (sporulation-specific penicillin-binding protein) [Amphibacillus marinus]